MLAGVLLLLQDAPPAPPPADTASARPPGEERSCGERPDGEIIVCGHTRSPYRLTPIGPPPGPAERPPMTIPFLGGTANLGATQAGMPDGKQSKRLMITVKLPF